MWRRWEWGDGRGRQGLQSGPEESTCLHAPGSAQPRCSLSCPKGAVPAGGDPAMVTDPLGQDWPPPQTSCTRSQGCLQLASHPLPWRREGPILSICPFVNESPEQTAHFLRVPSALTFLFDPRQNKLSSPEEPKGCLKFRFTTDPTPSPCPQPHPELWPFIRTCFLLSSPSACKSAWPSELWRSNLMKAFYFTFFFFF